MGGCCKWGSRLAASSLYPERIQTQVIARRAELVREPRRRPRLLVHDVVTRRENQRGWSRSVVLEIAQAHLSRLVVKPLVREASVRDDDASGSDDSAIKRHAGHARVYRLADDVASRRPLMQKPKRRRGQRRQQAIIDTVKAQARLARTATNA